MHRVQVMTVMDRAIAKSGTESLAVDRRACHVVWANGEFFCSDPEPGYLRPGLGEVLHLNDIPLAVIQ